MKKDSFILREGYKNITIIFAIALLFMLFISNCLRYIGIFVGIFFLYVYRNNYRHIFKNNQNILAPIDAVVSSIDKVNGKTKIYCKVSLCTHNHVLRAPIDSELKIKKYKHGLNLNPNTYKGSLYNEQIVLKFDDIKVKLISGLCNNKIKRIPNRNVIQGEKITVFLDGLVIISIDEKSKLMVNIGDKLISGQTVLFKRL